MDRRDYSARLSIKPSHELQGSGWRAGCPETKIVGARPGFGLVKFASQMTMF
jgi:hypothetical protein